MLHHAAPSLVAPIVSIAAFASSPRRRAVFYGVLMVTLLLPLAAPGAVHADVMADTTDVVDNVCQESFTVDLNGSLLRVPYCANRTLGTVYTDVRRAILVVCGTLRNADEYEAAVVEAGQMAGGADATTFIIAPQYLTEEDVQRFNLDDDYLFWAYMGWRKGDLSLSTVRHPRPARLSSFAVADTILLRLAATCPNLERIVVAGHSAGGQFSNLWTAGTAVHSSLQSAYGIPVRSIVANPSSYLYFNAARWIEGTEYEFAVPDAQTMAQCPGYDDYKYGLENPIEYMSSGSDTLRARYSSRDVAYLLGALDVNPYDYYLDRDCPAMLQGEYRLQRGLVYIASLTGTFGEGIWERQARAIVPGVAHDHTGMFTSTCGLYYLYDYGNCSAGPPAVAWTDATPTLLRAAACHAAAWGDFDGDRRPDLFLPATDGTDVLARNTAGEFSDVTQMPLNDSGRAMSGQWGDYDNDGRPDLFVASWRDPCHLYHNEGGGLFTDATPSALELDSDCVDAAWGDYDNDGDLDLYVLRTNNQTCRLFRNEAGVFTDVTVAPLNIGGNARCAAWGDYDHDRDLDLFVAGDGADHLLRNEGGTFVDVTAGPLADGGNGSSAAWGDYDNDGDLDLYIVNRGSSSHLVRNDGTSFTAIQSSPVIVMGNGHSASWADYDNDGYLDLFLSNDGQMNRLFHNLGGGSFEDATASPLDHQGANYSGAWADYDADGDLDLYLSVNSAPNHLFQNGTSIGHHWLQVRLTGTESNVSAIGTWVRVLAGGQWQVRQIGGDSGYMAQNLGEACFGLGEVGVADSVVVEWPLGITQRFGPTLVDRRMEVIESNEPVAAPEAGLAEGRLQVVPNPMRNETRFYPRAGAGASGEADAYVVLLDAGGRQVRRLSAASAVRAEGIRWDGRDEMGRRVSEGVYFARLLGSGAAKPVSVIVIR